MANSRLTVAGFMAFLGVISSGGARATVYYDYELAAQTGTSLLVSIENEISINERGEVAFIGDRNAANGFESVYVGAAGGALAVSINPTFSAANRVFGPGVEINNASPAQVGARDALSGNAFFRSWNVSTGAGTIIDRTDTGPFFDTGFRPGLNDSGQRTHGSTQDPAGAQEVLVLSGGGTVNVTNVVLGLRSAVANDGSVVARVGMNANETDPIIYYNAAGSPTTIASTGLGWTELGRSPGISQDGSIVVWCGNRGDGLGVFAAPISAPSNVTRIVGENAITTNPDLGYNAAGGDIYLTFMAAQRDSKIGIAHQQTAGPGLTAGNSFVVTFLGTPSAASVDNPKLPPGTPLFFSNQAGVWAVRVDLEDELEPPNGLVFNANSATPVAQVGETMHTSAGSFILTTITELYDPVANVALDPAGMPRTQRRGDHQVAFRATSGAATIVIRDRLGDPLSQNFPTGSAQGGDLVGQIGLPTAHLDVVYFGSNGSFTIPGGQARAFTDIKQNFFGSADLFARELAFHYVVLADSPGAFEDFATDADGDGFFTGLDTRGPDGVLTRDELLYSDKRGRGATPSQPSVVTATCVECHGFGVRFPHGWSRSDRQRRSRHFWSRRRTAPSS